MPPTSKVWVELALRGRKALAQAKTLGAKINKSFSKIRPIAGALGAAGGVALLTSLTKKTVDFDLALTRLSIQAGKSKEEQEALRESIMRVAEATGAAKNEMAVAAQAIVDDTADFEFAGAVMEDLAILSKVTGAELGTLGNIAAKLKLQVGGTNEEISMMLRVLTEQGEIGNFTLQEMAETLPMVLAAAVAANKTTVQGIRMVGAEMQIWERGFDSANKAANAYRATTARLAQQAGELEGMGIRVFGDTGEMRDISAILVDLFEKVGTKAEDVLPVATKIFGVENLAGVSAFLKLYKDMQAEGKSVEEELKRFASVSGTAASWQDKLSRVLETTGGKLEMFMARLDKIFDEAFMDNIDEFAKLLPHLTALIKFLVDNKEAIIAVWGLGKVGALAPVGAPMPPGVPMPGGKQPIGGGPPKPIPRGGKPPVPTKTPPSAASGAAAVFQGVGVGLAGAQVSQQLLDGMDEESRVRNQLEAVLNRQLSVWEQIRLQTATIQTPLFGETEVTREEIVKIFGEQVATKMDEMITAIKDQKLNVKVEVPSPLDPATGTPGTPTHGTP